MMILLGYIILRHTQWQGSHIKIFDICKDLEEDRVRENLVNLIDSGRLPISPKNIEIIKRNESISSKMLFNQKSKDAGLTLIGFRAENLNHNGEELFLGYEDVGNILFVNAHKETEIK